MGRRKRGNRRLPTGLYRHKVKDKEYWQIRRTIDGKTVRATLGRTDEMSEAEAIARYHEIMAAGPDAASSSSPSRSIGWTEFASDYYLPHVADHRAPRTLELERHCASWLAAHFQEIPIERIDTAASERYKGWRRAHSGRRGKGVKRQPPGARTINLELHTLSKALRFAVTLGMLAAAPKIVMLPEARERKEARWHTAEQMEAVLAAATLARFLLLLFAYHTGMRPGEVLTRCRDDIHLDDGYVLVGHRGEFRVKRERPRVVPLTPKLAAELRERWEDLPAEGPIFAGQNLRESLRRACRKAGVPELNPYGTRHSFISRWAAEGRSREALIKIVGHADGRMIDQVYAHFGTDELRNHMAMVGWGGED